MLSIQQWYGQKPVKKLPTYLFYKNILFVCLVWERERNNSKIVLKQVFHSLFCVRQRINRPKQSLDLLYCITSGKSVVFPKVRHWRALSRGRAAEKNIFSRVLRFNSHDNTAKVNIIIINQNKNKIACTKTSTAFDRHFIGIF